MAHCEKLKTMEPSYSLFFDELVQYFRNTSNVSFLLNNRNTSRISRGSSTPVANMNSFKIYDSKMKDKEANDKGSNQDLGV